MLKRGTIVQFVEKHKWCGALGFVEEVKKCGDDYRVMIGCPAPGEGTAYIFSMLSEKEFEVLEDGQAVLLPGV